MKRLILATFLLITAISAVSCNNKKNTADYVTDEDFIIYTDTTYPQFSADDIDAENDMKKPEKLAYALNGSRVELLLDGVLIKILEFYYTPSAEFISVADYNFDGYEDIYIPYESPPQYGTYYCYIPEKNTFEENAELNNIGVYLTINDGQILSEDRSDDLTKRFVEYKWDGAELKPIQKTETYKSSQTGEIVTDIYKYDQNGKEFLAG